MVKLIAQSPAAGLLPVTVGGLTLVEITQLPIICVMPFNGQSERVSADLGFAFPAPNRTTAQGGIRAIWAGRDVALVLHDMVKTNHASVTDQSDGWAVLALSGPNGADVLARLCPIDTRPEYFEMGHAARTLLGHQNACIARISADEVWILVARSMVVTALHHLTRAMQHAQRAGG